MKTNSTLLTAVIAITGLFSLIGCGDGLTPDGVGSVESSSGAFSSTRALAAPTDAGVYDPNNPPAISETVEFGRLTLLPTRYGTRADKPEHQVRAENSFIFGGTGPVFYHGAELLRLVYQGQPVFRTLVSYYDGGASRVRFAVRDFSGPTRLQDREVSAPQPADYANDPQFQTPAADTEQLPEYDSPAAPVVVSEADFAVANPSPYFRIMPRWSKHAFSSFVHGNKGLRVSDMKVHGATTLPYKFRGQPVFRTLISFDDGTPNRQFHTEDWSGGGRVILRQSKAPTMLQEYEKRSQQAK